MSNVSPIKPSRQLTWYRHWPKLSFFSDTNWRSMISRSGLPDQVTSLVFQVVSESRLSRFEKTQITKELLAHFEDGNERGKTFSTLIENFGDPTTAAALIRISKLRNRSMMSKLFRGSMWASFAGLIGYIGLAAFFHTEIPNVSVDYLNELNQAATSVAEEDKAWNVYRDVWAKYELFEFSRSQASAFQFEALYIKDGDTRIRFVKPSDGQQWEAATKELADSADLLESFRVGGAYPALGLALQADPNKYSAEDQAALFANHPAGEPFDLSIGIAPLSTEANQIASDAFFSILLPHVQSFRTSARILRVDTRWAMEQGDTERATRNIEAVFGLAHQVAETPCLVGSLVGIAVQHIGYSIIDESMSQRKFEAFNEQQLKRIQAAVTKHSIKEMIAFEAERIWAKDIIQRVYSDDGNGDGRMTPVGLEILSYVFPNLYHPSPSDSNKYFPNPLVQQFTGPMTLLTMPTRKQITDKLDEVMDEIETRFDTPIHLDDMSDVWVKDLKDDNCSFFSELPAAYRNIRQAMFRAIAHQGGVEMAIASYRYHKRNGVFPKSSQELVGEFLAAIPTDQLNGDPLKYKPTETGFKIYSVGYDLDDDNGQPIMIEAKDTNSDALLKNAVVDQASPLAPVNGMRPQTANEFSWAVGHEIVDGDWVIWPRFAEAEDDLRD